MVRSRGKVGRIVSWKLNNSLLISRPRPNHATNNIGIARRAESENRKMGCRMSDENKIRPVLLAPATSVPICMPNQENWAMPDCAPRKTRYLPLISVYLYNASRREHIHHAVIVCANARIAEPEFVFCWDVNPLHLTKFSFRRRRLGRPPKREILMSGHVVRRSREFHLTYCALAQEREYAFNIYPVPLQNLSASDPQAVSEAQKFIETWNRAGLDSWEYGMANYAATLLDFDWKIIAYSFDLRRL
jgi:hypothetical protein